ncbi:hypothetical protein HDU67_009466 [Dinochytrium kinnereticum]|nr:hypothetical protein HDU67_009466 [Dinochytrium kinnereticum]
MVAISVCLTALFPVFYASGALAQTGRVKSIVSFGDSMTDSGLAEEITKKNGPVIPSDAYFKGRFTNGPTYIEILAKNRDIPLNNNAVGGGTTSDKLVQGWLGGKFGEPLRSDGSIQPVPGVDTQIVQYLEKTKNTPGVKLNTTLFTIWSSGNDKFDNTILNLGKEGSYFAKSQYGNWEALAKSGAVNILTVVPAPFDAFDISYGTELVVQSLAFQAAYPQVKLELYQSVSIFGPIVMNPTAFGFEHTTTETCCTDCFSAFPPVGAAAVCADPDKWIIWDGIHVTAAVHRLVASSLDEFISQKLLRKMMFTRAALTVLLLASSAAASINTIVAFGDSLTDNGNAKALLAAVGIPFPNTFFEGRSSNGLTYIEVVANAYNVNLINRAVAGATTNDKIIQGFLGDITVPGGFLPVPGVDAQIDAYIKETPKTDKPCDKSSPVRVLRDPSTLVTIWAGGNDFLNNQGRRLNRTGDYFATANYDNWAALAKAGTKNILNIISARGSPFEDAYGNEVIKQAKRFLADFSNVRLELFEMSTVTLPIVADIKAAGFDHGFDEICCTDCITGLPPFGKATVCANPDKWMNYDGIHPTAELHRRYAKGVEAFIASKFGLDGF